MGACGKNHRTHASAGTRTSSHKYFFHTLKPIQRSPDTPAHLHVYLGLLHNTPSYTNKLWALSVR